MLGKSVKEKWKIKMFNKPLILALLVSLSLNGLFGYLSYHFHSEKAVAESNLESCKKANQSLVESADKADKTCKVGDAMASEFKREEQALEADRDDILKQLDSLSVAPKQDVKIAPKEATVNEESNVAGIDDLLPESIRMLTESACNRVQGKDCSHP